jgi:GDP-4-dehydro-6-deoxy-D-mannose reductase
LKTLITGVDGFAGSHLAEYLLSQGQEVIALVRNEKEVANLAPFRSRLRLEEADVRDDRRIFQVLRNTKPERIYHLAAMSSPSASIGDPRLTYDVNFGGTLNILCAWRQLQFDCRLLFVSSVDVYGPARSEDMPLREDAPFRPANPYAGSKAASELLAWQFFQSYGLPIVRVRPFHHTGPRQAPAFVCSDFARQIAEIELGMRPAVITVGNLKVSRDFCDVRDIVRGYHLLLEHGKPGDVYQLCSGCAVSIESILQVLMEFSSKPIEVTVDPSRSRSHEAPALWGDPTKAQNAVGWKPQHSLKTTLWDLAVYWKNALRS